MVHQWLEIYRLSIIQKNINIPIVLILQHRRHPLNQGTETFLSSHGLLLDTNAPSYVLEQKSAQEQSQQVKV